MLLMHNANTKEGGAEYAVEYIITKKRREREHTEERENNGVTEYGIRCNLYESDKLVDSEEVNGITTEEYRIDKFLQILVKNQVFPVHLKDVIEDLLVMEFEEKRVLVLT